MPPALLYVLPVVSTFAGGVAAIRLRRSVPLLTVVGAVLLLGAALFDLLPEAVALGPKAGLRESVVLGMVVGAFSLFYAAQAGLNAVGRRWAGAGVNRHFAGRTGAGLLIFHSLRDGMAIGAAYAVSHPAGYAVALGIAAHDLGDGINTVLLSTGGEAATGVDWGFLAADSLAPFAGVLLTAWWVFSVRGSVVLLVLAAGFFLHMALAGLGPEVRKFVGRRRVVVVGS